MNPPFVRSVGGNLLFGSLPDDRGAMQNELKKRVKTLQAALLRCSYNHLIFMNLILLLGTVLDDISP